MSYDDLLRQAIARVKIVKEPPTEAERREAAALALREYFKSFNKRRKKEPDLEKPLLYILFLEPFPVLSIYRKGDEDLGWQYMTFTSFRKARKAWAYAIRDYKKNAKHVRLGAIV